MAIMSNYSYIETVEREEVLRHREDEWRRLL